MAAPTKGDAQITYNPGSGLVTVGLQWPLFGITPGSARRRYVSESLDLKTREVLVIATAVPEIVGRLRFHDDALELLAMLGAGADGVTLNYYPSAAVPATYYPSLLVEPGGDVLDVLRDSSSWGAAGLSEVQIRLRRVDGGTYAGLFA